LEENGKKPAILLASCGDAAHHAGIGNEIWLFGFLETNYPNCSLICFNYSFFVGGGEEIKDNSWYNSVQLG